MQNKNILIHIIEDDIFFNRIIIILLESIGFSNIKSFNSGACYLNSEAYKNNPDIVLIGFYHDRGVTGKDLLDTIKATSEMSKIIMMSFSSDNSEQLDDKVFAKFSKSGGFVNALKDKLREACLEIEQTKNNCFVIDEANTENR